MSPENFDFAIEHHPALKARERLTAELKALQEGGEYFASGDAISERMIDGIIEEKHIRDLAEQFISDRRALDTMPTPYCYTHRHYYLDRCCFCANEEAKRQAKADAAEWAAQRDAQTGAARLFPVPVEPRRNRFGLVGVALFCIVSAGFLARWWHGG